MKRDELVGKQLQGPRGVALGGRTASQGDQGRFFGTSQEALAGGRDLLCADQSGRESLFDKALTDITLRIAMTVESGGDVRISPVRAVGIHVEQDMGMLDLRGRSLPVFGQLDECVSFVVCEAYNIGLVHVDSSIPHHAGS
jgi:hypothetical protein